MAAGLSTIFSISGLIRMTTELKTQLNFKSVQIVERCTFSDNFHYVESGRVTVLDIVVGVELIFTAT